MSKALPILGIAAAVLAAAFAWAVVGPFVPLLVLLFLLVVAVFLFVERRLAPVLSGAFLLLAAISALLYFNPITNESGTLIPKLPDLFAGPYQAALCIVAWGALFLARSDEVEPTWFLAAGPVVAVLAILATLLVPSDQFGNFAAPVNIVAGVLSLTLIVPMALLLRGPREEPPPAPSPFQPVRTVPPGLKPAQPVKPIPTFAAPLKKAPAPAPQPPGQPPHGRLPPK